MAHAGSICKGCEHHRTCESYCPAAEKLEEVYLSEKRLSHEQIIKELRPLLGIRDAEIDDGIREIAEQIIKKKELAVITDYDIRIGYVKSYENKTKDGRVIFGDCRKVNTVYGAYLPYDIIITLYEPNIALLNENQVKLVIYHELLHIGMGERGITINPHEIEDFYAVTDKYGTRWQIDDDVPDILED